MSVGRGHEWLRKHRRRVKRLGRNPQFLAEVGQLLEVANREKWNRPGLLAAFNELVDNWSGARA